MITRSGRLRVRPTVVALVVPALVVAGSVAAIASTSTAQAGVVVAAAAVEDEGADCAVPTLPDVSALPTTMTNGNSSARPRIVSCTAA